jgi:3-deoxy-7-phosphoheptulonate synthase
MRRPTEDLRILQTRPLIPPAILHEELPVGDDVAELISNSRDAISDVIHGRDLRMVAIVGPCSIHDADAA